MEGILCVDMDVLAGNICVNMGVDDGQGSGAKFFGLL
jgi:hypothetical protein